MRRLAHTLNASRVFALLHPLEQLRGFGHLQRLRHPAVVGRILDCRPGQIILQRVADQAEVFPGRPVERLAQRSLPVLNTAHPVGLAGARVDRLQHAVDPCLHLLAGDLVDRARADSGSR